MERVEGGRYDLPLIHAIVVHPNMEETGGSLGAITMDDSDVLWFSHDS